MEQQVKKFGWKFWGVVALGGVAAVAAVGFYAQSKQAALGRRVQRNVVKFLVDHGATAEHGMISGGLVNVPMSTAAAVNSTVVTMLNAFSEQLGGQPPRRPRAPVEDEEAASEAPAAAAAAASPLARKASAMTVASPSAMADDGGYGQAEGRPKKDVVVRPYDSSEFVQTSKTKPPDNIDLFADDA